MLTAMVIIIITRPAKRIQTAEILHFNLDLKYVHAEPDS